MKAFFEGLFTFLGRAMLVAVFLGSAAHMISPEGWAETKELMAKQGMDKLVPNNPYAIPVLLGAAVALESLGSFAVLLGYKARTGAVMLLVFLATATYFFHPFWKMTDPAARGPEMINFMKNAAIAGGLLMVLARGPGRGSVEGSPLDR
jgi:putative oxidoreductase